MENYSVNYHKVHLNIRIVSVLSEIKEDISLHNTACLLLIQWYCPCVSQYVLVPCLCRTGTDVPSLDLVLVAYPVENIYVA